MIHQVINFLFPKTCLNCGSGNFERGAMCPECFSSIKTNQTLFCGRCLARLPEEKKVCHRDYPYLLGAAGNYEDEVLRRAILKLKFNGVRGAAVNLAELLVNYAEKLALNWEERLVVPIPLSPKRERERGFNQSRAIAEIFASRMGMGLALNNLIKVRHTDPQNEISNYQLRARNIAGAFAVRDGSEFRGKKLVLIDDVATSGSTLRESAQVLRNAGAKKILALAVAKA